MNINCRHFVIPVLDQEEVKATLESFPLPPDFYEQISNDLKNILRIPFNIWLLKKLLSHNRNIFELTIFILYKRRNKKTNITWLIY